MNLIASSRQPWTSVKAQYLIAACGIALAVAALAGLGSWRDRTLAEPSAAVGEKRPVASLDEWPRELVRLLVASEQQARDAAASLYQDMNESFLSYFAFVVVSDAGEEAAEREAAVRTNFELGQVASPLSMRVVDLR